MAEKTMDILKEEFSQLDSMCTELSLQKGTVHHLPISHNKYILIDGVPLSAILGSEWRDKKDKEREEEQKKTGRYPTTSVGRAKYQEYLASEQYKEDTEKKLEEYLKKGSIVEVYAPGKDMKLPKTPKYLINGTLVTEPPESLQSTLEQGKEKRRQALRIMEKQLFFDNYARCSPLNQKELFFKSWIDKKNRSQEASSTPITVEHLTNNTEIFQSEFKRVGAIAYAIAELVVNQGMSIEDAFDPTKEIEKKQAASEKMMTKYEEGNRKYFAQLYEKFIPQAMQYSLDSLKNVDMTDSDQLFRDKNFMPFCIGSLLSDMLTFTDAIGFRPHAYPMRDFLQVSLNITDNRIFPSCAMLAGYASGDRGFQGNLADNSMAMESLRSHLAFRTLGEVMKGDTKTVEALATRNQKGFIDPSDALTVLFKENIAKDTIQTLTDDEKFFQRKADRSTGQEQEAAREDLENTTKRRIIAQENLEKSEAFSESCKQNEDLLLKTALFGNTDDVIDLSEAKMIRGDFHIQYQLREKEALSKYRDVSKVLDGFVASCREQGLEPASPDKVEGTAVIFSASKKNYDMQTTKGLLRLAQDCHAGKLQIGDLCVFKPGEANPYPVESISGNGELTVSKEPYTVAFVGEEPPKPNWFQKKTYSWFGWFSKKKI